MQGHSMFIGTRHAGSQHVYRNGNTPSIRPSGWKVISLRNAVTPARPPAKCCDPSEAVPLRNAVNPARLDFSIGTLSEKGWD